MMWPLWTMRLTKGFPFSTHSPALPAVAPYLFPYLSFSSHSRGGPGGCRPTCCFIFAWPSPSAAGTTHHEMNTTQYFLHTRKRSDRAIIRDEWILETIAHPEKSEVQTDGRIRCWAKIPEMDNRVLRVILLNDGLTVHNAFFDRSTRL